MLKSRSATLVQNSSQRTDRSNRYIQIKITSGNEYFMDAMNPGGDKVYTADQICTMLEVLVDKINPTQYTKVSNCYTCTKLIEEERWK